MLFGEARKDAGHALELAREYYRSVHHYDVALYRQTGNGNNEASDRHPNVTTAWCELQRAPTRRPYLKDSLCVVLPERQSSLVESVYDATAGLGQLVYHQKHVASVERHHQELGIAREAFGEFCAMHYLHTLVPTSPADAAILPKDARFIRRYEAQRQGRAFYENMIKPFVPITDNASADVLKQLTEERMFEGEALLARGAITRPQLAARHFIVENMALGGQLTKMATLMLGFNQKQITRMVNEMKWFGIEANVTSTHLPGLGDSSPSGQAK
jgi:hypothetical protein